MKIINNTINEIELKIYKLEPASGNLVYTTSVHIKDLADLVSLANGLLHNKPNGSYKIYKCQTTYGTILGYYTPAAITGHSPAEPVVYKVLSPKELGLIEDSLKNAIEYMTNDLGTTEEELLAYKGESTYVN